MQKTYPAKITQVGNSKGVRLPKAVVLSLGTDNVLLEVTPEGILIRPAPIVAPLKQWTAIMAKMKVSREPEFLQQDITISDGLEIWED